MDDIRLWTLAEVAEQTGFALRTLERDCRAGRVEHVHRGRVRCMTTPQVQALIARHIERPIGNGSKAAARLERMLRKAG